MHAYLFWHLARLPWWRSGNGRRYLLWGGGLLWLLFLTGTLYGHDGGGGLAAVLERLAMDWFGVLFIASVVMVIADLLSIALFRCRSCRTRLLQGAVMVTVVLVGVALLQGARAPVVVRYAVTLSQLPYELDGTTLAVLSDLHLGSQLGAAWLQARVEQVLALQPDVIVLLGDNFEGHGDPPLALRSVFARLKAPLGVYAVTGNHEHFGDVSPAITLTEQAGVRWLRDRVIQLRPGLSLAGVDDLTTRWRHGQSQGIFNTVLADAPAGGVIVLSHSPLQVGQAAEAGAGLMLSGHNHGGQIWPFGYLVQHFYTYLAGRYEVDGMSLIISRGTGLWGPRMRLWRPGEILLVTLHAE